MTWTTFFWRGTWLGCRTRWFCRFSMGALKAHSVFHTWDDILLDFLGAPSPLAHIFHGVTLLLGTWKAFWYYWLHLLVERSPWSPLLACILMHGRSLFLGEGANPLLHEVGWVLWGPCTWFDATILVGGLLIPWIHPMHMPWWGGKLDIEFWR